MYQNLRHIHISLHERALEALAAKDAADFLTYADNMVGLKLVHDNRGRLISSGIFEQALLHAFIHPRVNTYHIPPRIVRTLLHWADRGRLRSAGAPLGHGPFTLYRGVAGHGRARRIRGLFWTGS